MKSFGALWIDPRGARPAAEVPTPGKWISERKEGILDARGICGKLKSILTMTFFFILSDNRMVFLSSIEFKYNIWLNLYLKA